MNIGCHVSVSKGFLQAAKKAHSLGATAFQVFSKNPRGLRPKKLNHEDADSGRNFCSEHHLTVVIHTPYITNLSTPKADLQEVTVRSISEDLSITKAYGGLGAVVHCGKHVGEGVEEGKRRMIMTLDLIIEQTKNMTDMPLILLENTAGQGTEIGTTLDELAEIRAKTCDPRRIAFCFDTCHAFAAGLWQKSTVLSLVQEMKQSGYLDHLAVIHFNDSRMPFCSNKDRHAKIGYGEIGVHALHEFLIEGIFADIPFILETPVSDESEYAKEITYLHQIYDKKHNELLPEVPIYE